MAGGEARAWKGLAAVLVAPVAGVGVAVGGGLVWPAGVAVWGALAIGCGAVEVLRISAVTRRVTAG